MSSKSLIKNGGLILFVVMVGALATRLIHGTSLDDALSIASFAVIFLYFSTHFDKRVKEPT